MIAAIFYLVFILTGIAKVEPTTGELILAVLAACEAPFWWMVFGMDAREQIRKSKENE
jgi:hypothetical protein